MLEILRDRELAELLAYWATIIGIIIAVAGGSWALWKNRRDQKLLEWTRARASYASFIDTAIAHPEFVPGYWTNCVKGDAEKLYKYLWFMAKFLWASEEVLKNMLTEKDQWREAISQIIREHADFFRSPIGAKESHPYAPVVRDMIAETLDSLDGGNDCAAEFDTYLPSKQASQRQIGPSINGDG